MELLKEISKLEEQYLNVARTINSNGSKNNQSEQKLQNAISFIQSDKSYPFHLNNFEKDNNYISDYVNEITHLYQSASAELNRLKLEVDQKTKDIQNKKFKQIAPNEKIAQMEIELNTYRNRLKSNDPRAKENLETMDRLEKRVFAEIIEKQTFPLTNQIIQLSNNLKNNVAKIKAKHINNINAAKNNLKKSALNDQKDSKTKNDLLTECKNLCSDLKTSKGKYAFSDQFHPSNINVESFSIGGISHPKKFKIVKDCGFSLDNLSLNLHVRSGGNIIVDYDKNSIDSEMLNKIVLSIVCNYFDNFKTGKIKVTYCSQLDNLINTITNAIYSPSSRDLETIFHCKEDEPLKTLKEIKTQTDFNVCKKLSSSLKDLYDLLEKLPDDESAFNLIIIKQDLEYHLANREEYRNVLTNMMKNDGVYHRAGIRFLILNEKEDHDISYSKIDTISEFKNNVEHIFEISSNKVYLDKDWEVNFTSIPEPIYPFAENRFKEIASKILSIEKDTISFEDINFGKEKVDDPLQTYLDIPIGKAGNQIIRAPLSCASVSGNIESENIGFIVCGQTGSGKSSFIHSFIINGCMKYSPDDLEIWMLDFKDSVSSSNYDDPKNTLPHIKYLAPNGKIDDFYILLKMLSEEKERRNNLFKDLKETLGHVPANIAEYNAKVAENPSLGKRLPRIVVIVDEIQNVFNQSDNDSQYGMTQDIIASIGRIATESRSAGIHLVFCCQNLSLGRSHRLKEAFVNHVKGRVMFRLVDEEIANCNFGDGFSNFKNEISALPNGDAFFSVDSTHVIRMRFAYASTSEFNKYFKQIREKYKDYPCQLRRIGNVNALRFNDRCQNEAYSYSDLLAKPNVNKCQYNFVIGENTISLEPQPIAFNNSSGSSLMMFGNNDAIRNSIFTSLLSQAFLTKSSIYLCNGCNSDGSLKTICSYLRDNHSEVFKQYAPSKIGELLNEVYNVFKKRVSEKENDLDGDMSFDPIFVFINGADDIENIKNNKEIASTNETKVAVSENPIYNAFNSINNAHSIDHIMTQNVIGQLLSRGPSLRIHLVISSNTISDFLYSYNKSSNNVLFFNDCLVENGSISERSVTEVLDSFKKMEEQTLAYGTINGSIRKLRPIIFSDNDKIIELIKSKGGK